MMNTFKRLRSASTSRLHSLATMIAATSKLLAVFLLLCVTLDGRTAFAQPAPRVAKTTPPAGTDYLRSVVWVKVKPAYAAVLSSPGGRVASLPGVASARPLVPGASVPAGRRGPVNQTVDITRYHTLVLEPG